MSELICIHDAVSQKIKYLRRPIWANKFDHIKIQIIENQLGPWVELYCPFNQECNGRDPVSLLITQFDRNKEEWEPYLGPLHDAPEYLEERKRFEGCLEGGYDHRKQQEP